MNTLNIFWKALCLLLLIQSAFAQQDKFTEQLIKGRYELRLDQSRLSGSGAPVLEKAIGNADFVMIGEDHGIAQIPQFVGAICDLLGPKGLHTMAVETGPLVARELERWSQSSDGRSEVVAFVKKYPESIAFYDYQEEFDLLRHCAHSAAGGRFHLWGLDQEFMGSSGFIFDQILATHPGKEAEAAFRDLAKQNDEAHARAATSGNPEMLFMLSAQESSLNSARDLLNKEGSRAAQELFASFLESRSIYQKFLAGAGYDSNRQRALLMKKNFALGYAEETRAQAGMAPKVLLKFGGNHLYKGFNQLHNNDLGNYVLELAEGRGSRSVNILILAVSGSQLAFAGVGRPYHAVKVDPQDKNSDIARLQPIFANMNRQGWTLFDLRNLRPGFTNLNLKNADVEHMVFAYDFLILFPDALPATQIQ